MSPLTSLTSPAASWGTPPAGVALRSPALRSSAQPAPGQPPAGSGADRLGLLRTSIGAKVAALAGGLILVLLLTNGLLLIQLSSTVSGYDEVLSHEVHQALTARTMQVEFKKQVQEWKDILLRGANPTDRVTYTTNFHNEFAAVNTLVETLAAQVADPQAAQDVAQFRDAHTTLQANYEKALSGFVASGGTDFQTADHAVRGQDRPPTALVDGIVQRLQDRVDAAVAQQKSAATTRQRLLLIGGLLGVAVLVALLVLVVRRIVGPVRRLTHAAYQAAAVTLPRAVEQIAATTTAAQPPDLPAFPVETADELAELSSALTAMQEKAVQLAVEQHRRDRETADMLLNLGRRNQTLLARVLGYITDLERTEQDPDVVAELFRIDHATTRIRRNAASMLVLAGASPAPSRAQAVPASDVVRAALSEIEDYNRVDLHHLEDVGIVGGAAADLTHLLAELLENATNFSPPTTRVTVVGQRMSDGYRIRVIDQGIGMTRDELVLANDRIVNAALGRSDARLLGLHVVGRLAARHEVAVALEASAGLGITATVLVPTPILTGLLAARRPVLPVPPVVPQVVDEPALALAPAGVAEVIESEPARVAPVVIDLRDKPSRPGAAARGEGVPTRVRGDSLARLGLIDDGPVVAFDVPTDASSARLRSFQLDVDAARRAVHGDPDQAGPATDTAAGSATRAGAASAPDIALPPAATTEAPTSREGDA